jgi:stage V sporulation protein B
VSSTLDPRTRVARGTTYLFVQGFLTAAIGVLYIMVITRMLTTEDMGVYALFTLMIGLVQIIGVFALPSASIKYVAQYLAKGNQAKARSVVARVLQICLTAATIVFLVLFVPAEWLSTVMFGSSGNALLFRTFAFICFFTILFAIVIGFLKSLQKMRDVAILSLVNVIIKAALGIYLVSTGSGLFGVIFGWLGGLIIPSIVGLILTAKHLSLREKPHPAKPLFRFSYPLYIANILGFSATWIDQLFILLFLGEGALGVYYIAVRAAMVPALLSTSLVTALFPQLSELYTKGGSESLRDAFHVSTRYTALIGFPMIIGLAVLAYPIMILFAGIEYAEATLPLIIICFAALSTTIGVAIGPILMTIERTKTASLLTIASILTNISVSYVTLTYLNLGLAGPAGARTIASVISLGLGVYLLSTIFSLSFDKEALWKASAASIFMAAMILLTDVVRQFLTPFPTQFLVIQLRWLPLYVLIGAVAYFFALVALKAMQKRDIELFRDYLPARLKWIANWFNRLAT